MDSIFLLFEKVETKHGWPLVSHALAYVTAAKNGVSETELEDLISLDDKVLDDIYQYHLPPTRRIPPLLWTRYVPLVSNTACPKGPTGIMLYKRSPSFICRTGPMGPTGPMGLLLYKWSLSFICRKYQMSSKNFCTFEKQIENCKFIDNFM
jgi:hypothetical protein